MKIFVFIGAFLVLFSTAVEAETVYVGEIIEITLRSGPGVDHRVISMIKSGQEAEILQPGDEWTLVRLPTGKEGWVLNRFLTPKKPGVLVLEQMKEKNKALEAQVAALLEENTKRKEESKRLGSELAENIKTVNALRQSYETLKKESADFLKLKSEYQQASLQLKEQTREAEQFKEELSRLQNHQNLQWFLSGAGVLLLGFLIGFSSKRQRRRSSLL